MSEKLRIAFMGTPDFAVPALEALIDHGYNVVCVYSQPPRPKGRGKQVQPSPVHMIADAHGIEVRTPLSLKKDEKAQTEFSALDLDVAIVAAYGLILPKTVLEAPKHGCLNIHASLLPRWRGASPIQHAIWKGDDKSGVGIMQMEEGLDTGPVLDERAVAIRPQTTAQSLHDELSALGSAAMIDVLRQIESGKKPEAVAQDDSLSTYAPMLSKEDGKVDWTQTAGEIDCQIRALNPWPGVWSVTGEGKRIKILAAEPVVEAFTEPPGTVLDNAGHVVCGNDTALRIIKVQPENAKPMDFVSALNGNYMKIDDILD